MSATSTSRRPVVLGIFLIVAGAVGFWAAFNLVIEKFTALAHPNDKLGCDFSIVVQCTKNLDSWQGSLFGFPNPIIGLGAWPIVIVMGVGLLAGIRFPRWYWIAFNVGVALALVFVIFLIGTSFFSIGTLCIYCMFTWMVTIPTFWIVTIRSFRDYGRPGAQRVAKTLYGWVPIITLVSYAIVALIAQLQLNVIVYL